MNTTDIKKFFESEIVGFNFEMANQPLGDVFDGFPEDEINKNKKRFNQLKSIDKMKVLNLKILAKGSEFESIFMSVIFDSETNQFVVFYNVYMEYVTNYSNFFEVENDYNKLIEKIYEFLISDDVYVNPDELSKAIVFN